MDGVILWVTMGNQEALPEGYDNLGVDCFPLGKSQLNATQKCSYQRAIQLISIAEKQRSLPYSLMWRSELIDETIDACRRDCGEAEFQLNFGLI